MAGWGSGKSQLPKGKHVAQVRDVKNTMSKGFQDKAPAPQFEWGVDVQINGQWIAHTIYTGQNFCDPSSLSNPQFVPKLMRLVKACGVALPTNAAEAQRWDPQILIGKQFGIQVDEDPETNALVTRYVLLKSQGQQSAAPAADPFTGDAGSTTPREPALAGAGASSNAAPDPW